MMAGKKVTPLKNTYRPKSDDGMSAEMLKFPLDQVTKVLEEREKRLKAEIADNWYKSMANEQIEDDIIEEGATSMTRHTRTRFVHHHRGQRHSNWSNPWFAGNRRQNRDPNRKIESKNARHNACSWLMPTEKCQKYTLQRNQIEFN